MEMYNNQPDQLTSSNALQSRAIETLTVPNFVEKYSLNTKQTKAFSIVQSHMQLTLRYQDNKDANCTKPEQLLMHIGSSIL